LGNSAAVSSISLSSVAAESAGADVASVDPAETNFHPIEKEGRKMNLQTKRSLTRQYRWMAVMVLLVSAFVLGCSKKEATTASETSQKTFATPAEAGKALQTAVMAKDDGAMGRILGPKAKTLVSSGDPAEDAAAIDSFGKKYDRMNRWVAMTDGSQVLHIGADNYPFPVPLVQDASSQWHFDPGTGDEELRARRIGRNELLAIEACKLIASAEELYHQNAQQYTDTIISTPGKQDGLYWEAPEGQSSSPLGTRIGFAKGIFVSGAPSKNPVFNGYNFRVLTAQAGTAKGGAKNYIANGKMTGGFAIIASPVNYQESGIMTFVLGRDGILYQQDLGPQTPNAAAVIQQYDPNDGWAQAE
jgi:hypothetical protein